MIRKTGLIVAMLLCASVTAEADEAISLKLGYANLTPKGSFSSSNISSATRVGIDSLLQLKNNSGVTVEAAVQFGNHRLSLNVLPLSFKGSNALTQTVSFGGKSFAANTTVNSSFKDTMYDIGYTYFFINMDDMPSRLQMGAEFTVKINQIKTSISGGGQSASTSTIVPIPTIGLRGRVALADFLGLVGRVGYLTVGNRGSYLDADAQVEFSPLPMAGIYAGYHYIKVKVDTTSAYIDLSFAGPYVGGLIRF